MNICLVSPTFTPYGVGIGFREKDCEIFAMSECCGGPIHYDLSSKKGVWVCSSCRIFIRNCNLGRDAVRRSAQEITRSAERDPYVIEELKTFVWWWTGYSQDDIQIEVTW